MRRPGDREAPIAVPAQQVPQSCYWWTDPDGALCLLPGCLARINDPDAACTCRTLASRLTRAEERLAEAAERERYASTWWAALRAAVDAHPARDEILSNARRRAGR
ncbi:hypothetical protein [Streptomyces sp. NPDC002746]